MAGPLSPDPAATLARVRDAALALPETEEATSHGQPGFRVTGGRFFAYFWHDHHSDGESAVMVKTCGADEQAVLIETDPATYYKPAYLGSSGWIAIRVGGDDADWNRVGDRIATSWELAAPRRLLEAGGR